MALNRYIAAVSRASGQSPHRVRAVYSSSSSSSSSSTRPDAVMGNLGLTNPPCIAPSISLRSAVESRLVIFACMNHPYSTAYPIQASPFSLLAMQS